MSTLREALGKLAAEGTADQIAVALAAQGVTGVRSDSRACPVANYLRNATEDLVAVNAGQCWDRHRSEFLPGAVATFVVSFDMGFYPELNGAM